MKTVYDLRDCLDKELTKIVMKGDISPAELENAKHIVEIYSMIDAMGEEPDDGHSGTYPMHRDRRYSEPSYVDWGYGRSYGMDSRRPRMRRSYDMDRGYSGHEPMEYIISELRRLHAKTTGDRERDAIAECIDRLEE